MRLSVRKLLTALNSEFTPDRRRLFIAMSALLVIASLFRYTDFLMQERHAQDEKLYIRAVERHLNRHQETYDFPPLMHLAGYGVCRLTGGAPEKVLRILNFAYGLAFIVMIYFLGRDVCGDCRVGLIAAILASFNPAMSDFSTAILRESLYLLLFVCFLWGTVRLIKQRGGAVLSIGLAIVACLGTFTRIEGFELFGIYLAAVIFMLLRRRDGVGAGVVLRHALLFVLTSGALILACYVTDRQYFSFYRAKITQYKNHLGDSVDFH